MVLQNVYESVFLIIYKIGIREGFLSENPKIELEGFILFLLLIIDIFFLKIINCQFIYFRQPQF